MSGYELPDLRTPEEIRQQITDQIVSGYKPVFEEAITFISGTLYYTLNCDGETSKKAYDVLKVKGELDGTEHEFAEANDFTLYDSTGDGFYDQISFDVGGDIPDNNTVFYVDYRYMITPSGLTDTTEGSILMQLVGAVALQIYKVELQNNSVARDSFVDSADGPELDGLGKLVEVSRNVATRSTGFVTLARPSSMANQGVVEIPVGTQISTTGSSSLPAITFETIIAAEIANTETVAEISDLTHAEYGAGWIPVQSIYPGITQNVSSGKIIRNINADSVITTISNPSSFNQSDEQVDGTGTTQVFTLLHTPDSSGLVDKDADGKAIEMINELAYGWLDQPSTGTLVKATIKDTGGTPQLWTGKITIVGYANSELFYSETLTFDGSTNNETTTNTFSQIFHITIVKSGGGGLEATRYLTLENSGASEQYVNHESCGGRVDSGFLILRHDPATDIEVYLDTGTWTLQTITTDYTVSNPTFGGLTWTLLDWVNWKTGSKVNDGTQNVKYEYVPHSDWFVLTDDSLELEGSPRSQSYLEVDYAWNNPFQDGADTEDDDTYRERIKTGVSRSAKGTLDAIRAAVLAVDGIVGATVDDHSTDGTINVGEFYVYAWTQSGILSEAKRSQVSNAVEGSRAAGTKPYIYGPDPIYIAIEVDVKVLTGSGYALASVETSCEDALEAWLDNFEIGSDIMESELISMLESIAGVEYIDVDSIVMKGFNNLSDTTPSTREPHTGGWNWTAGTHWNIVGVATGSIVKPDTDQTGGSGSCYYIDVTAAYVG
jgi:uncharacterized phage protein gp47/JayE